MPRNTDTLAAWINGRLAGHWHAAPRQVMEFSYEDAWIAAPEGRPLSLSLPFTLDNAPIKGKAVEMYFENLLPDSDAIRRRLRKKFHTVSGKAFDLLTALGRDCVGALQLLPPGETPDVKRIDAKPLTDAEVERHLTAVVSPIAFAAQEEEDGFRISIAGAQEKTALLRHEGKWCLPLGATPSTHIFKLPLGKIGNTQIDLTTSVENEWLCAKILGGYGLPIARSDISVFGEQKALVVARFDRQLAKGGRYWHRLVQEDFCQATATAPDDKYEERGGPGIIEITELLRGSEQRDSDLAVFMKAQLLFWMLAAIDGHAKNFSLFILPKGQYRLTPLYDVLSAWPVIGHGPNHLAWEKVKLAMAFRGKNKQYKLKDIQRRHINATTSKTGLAASAEPFINEILATTPSVISNVQSRVPAGFPQQVLDSILNGLTASAKRLGDMPA